MKIVKKILGFGLLAASIAFLRGRRRAQRLVRSEARGADARFDDNFGTSVPTNENLVDVATQSGIADVDPVPLSQVAGEGIDPTRDVKAHEDIHELRERMPRH